MGMELSVSHLRYLLTIDELAKKTPDVGSLKIAQMLKVSKPSVTAALETLMKRGLLVKERYGKIYLTNRGVFAVRYYQKLIQAILADFPAVELELTVDEKETAAISMAVSLPTRDFSKQYDTLFGAD